MPPMTSSNTRPILSFTHLRFVRATSRASPVSKRFQVLEQRVFLPLRQSGTEYSALVTSIAVAWDIGLEGEEFLAADILSLRRQEAYVLRIVDVVASIE